MVLETSSPRARLMARVLALLTVAARFRAGEHASSSGETGAGKLLWLNRPSFSALGGIVLVVSIPGPNAIHGFQGRIALQSFGGPKLDQSVVVSRRRVLCVEVAFWAGAEMPTWFPTPNTKAQ